MAIVLQKSSKTLLKKIILVKGFFFIDVFSYFSINADCFLFSIASSGFKSIAASGDPLLTIVDSNFLFITAIGCFLSFVANSGSLFTIASSSFLFFIAYVGFY